MSDFIAQIQAVLDTSKIEAQLNALKSNQKIKLDVELSGDGAKLTKLLDSQMSSMSATATKAGQNIGKSLSQGIKSVKFDGFYKNYFKQIEKDTKKAEDLVTKYTEKNNKQKDKKVYVPTQAEALKAVKAKHSAQLKVAKEEQAEILKQQKLISDYTRKFEQGNYKATQNTMQSQLKKYADYNNVSLGSARKYATEFDKIQSTLSKHFDGSARISDNDLVSYFSKAEDAAKKFSNEMKVVSTNAAKPLSILEATTASNKTMTWLNNNTKAAKEYGQVLRELSDRQKVAISREELNGYNKQFKSIVSEAEKQGMVGNSFMVELKRGFGQIGQFVGVYGVLQRGVDVAKQMAQAVLDVNTAMTELRKVSNASDVQLNTYFDEATESAKKYGATISDVINSAADWSRLGYSLDDSKRLSDITTLYQRVGDNMTQETASKSLVSTLQGFKLNADEAEHIVDSFNEVDILAS